MSLLNLDVDNATPLVFLPEGEYQLRILSAEVKTSKNDESAQYLNLRCEAIDHPEAEDIYHIMMLPQASGGNFADESARAKQNNKRLLAFKELGQAASINFSECDVKNDLPGCEFRALLSVKDDAEYGEKQIIKKVFARR